VDLESLDRQSCFIYSDKAMGNGRFDDIRDILWVDPESFDRSRTVEMAGEIEELNTLLRAEGRRYVLIGPGRWGTRDRWLGIPVTFAQISRSRVIVEADLEDFVVESSLGSHFFHNVTSMNIGYLKVAKTDEGFVDWGWLRSMPCARRTAHCRWTRLDSPGEVLMDGRTSKAALLSEEGKSRRPSPGWSASIDDRAFFGQYSSLIGGSHLKGTRAGLSCPTARPHPKPWSLSHGCLSVAKTLHPLEVDPSRLRSGSKSTVKPCAGNCTLGGAGKPGLFLASRKALSKNREGPNAFFSS
jgi:hypothetical protein